MIESDQIILAASKFFYSNKKSTKQIIDELIEQGYDYYEFIKRGKFTICRLKNISTRSEIDFRRKVEYDYIELCLTNNLTRLQKVKGQLADCDPSDFTE